MATPLGISLNPTVHDLNFSFKDSCNCCCWGAKKHPKQEDNIFLNKDGTYEKFNPKKTRDKIEANRVSLARLNEKIDKLSEQSALDVSHVKHRILCESGVCFDEVQPSPMSYKTLQQVNSVFLNLLQENRRKSEGYDAALFSSAL